MVDMQEVVNSEEKIKIAAEKIFLEKGYDGARMQDIADQAGVNKAMLNYYFRSKKALFEIIFLEKFASLFGNLGSIMISAIAFEEKITKFVTTEIEIVSQFPLLPLFIINEIQKNPNLLEEKFKNFPLHLILQGVKSQYDKEVKEGRFRPLPFEQFMVNMIALCLFPILAKQVLKFMLNFDDHHYDMFLEDRKVIVSDFLKNYMIVK